MSADEGLTRQTVDLLIEKVRLFPDSRIEIEWKAVDFIKEDMKNAE